MKIVISAAGETWDSQVAPRFGRCPYFAIVDLDAQQLEALANPFQDAPEGAGTQSAQFVVEQGAAALLTGKCGPKASAVLADAGVEVVSGVAGLVREAVEQYQRRTSGSATEPANADAASGLGFGRGRGGPGRGRGRSDRRLGGGAGCGCGRGHGGPPA